VADFGSPQSSVQAMSESKSPLDRLEERAWASFALHAGQRLTTFNFFIVLSSLLVGAMVTTFQKDFRVPYLGVVVGLLLALLSFIFWKIDVRNKHLIKLSEKAIIHFEELAPKPDGANYHPAAYFLREAYETDERKAVSGLWHFSYSKAFAAVYILVACTGIAGAVLGLLHPGSDATGAAVSVSSRNAAAPNSVDRKVATEPPHSTDTAELPSSSTTTGPPPHPAVAPTTTTTPAKPQASSEQRR
jgi:hypothetical protein